MATENRVPMAYPTERHIAEVWSVPQGLSSLSPPGHSHHSQGKGRQLTPVVSPASSWYCTQPIVHLLPLFPMALYSSPAAEPENTGTHL